MNSTLIKGDRPLKRLFRSQRAEAGLFFILLTWVTTVPDLGAASAPEAFAQNQRLGRGVNILGYDPIWRSREQARFQAKHFRLLDEAGFDSVRINLHPFRHASRAPGWKLPDDWFATVDWAVTNALGNGLTVILDLHEFNAMAENPEGRHDQFLATWRQ
jgi:endoglucanase